MQAAWWQSTNEAQLQCAAAGRQCSAGNDAQQAAMQLTAMELAAAEPSATAPAAVALHGA